MIIKKEDLKLIQRYQWVSRANRSSERPFFGDHLIFNRHDGYQVLHLINKLSAQLSGGTSSRKIEEMLIFLPEKSLTHIQVKEWVIDNWNKGMKVK